MSGATPIIPSPFRGVTSVTLGNVPVGQGTSPLIGLPLQTLINFGLLPAQTSVANDSIKITGQTAALSATNPAYVTLMSSVTAGREVVLEANAESTINLTGAHWGAGTKGDLTGAILHVYAINNNGTLKFGIGYVGGRGSVINTDTSTTATSVTLPEMLLVNSALTAGTWPCREIGYFFANFDDTGGSSEDLWSVGTLSAQLVVGQSADGIWQPFNTTMTGFSADQTFSNLQWTQFGRSVRAIGIKNADGTSNATTFTVELPVKAAFLLYGWQSQITNNSVAGGAATCRSRVGSTTLDLFINPNLGVWTNVNNKGSSFDITYPAA